MKKDFYKDRDRNWGKEPSSHTSYYRNNSSHKSRTGRRSGSGTIITVLVLLTLAALIALVFYSFLSSFFDLKTVRLAKEGAHTEEEIIVASGIELGTKIYKIDEKDAESKIREKYPEINYVKITKIFPAEIIIDLVYEEPKYYTYVSGEYFTLSENLYVLERISSKKECEKMRIVYLVTPEVKRAVTGEYLVFSDNDGDYIAGVLDSFSESELYSDVNTLYIESKFDIVAVKTDYYKVLLGNCHEMELKLKMAKKILDQTAYRDETGVIVDASNVSECSAKVDKTAKIE